MFVLTTLIWDSTEQLGTDCPIRSICERLKITSCFWSSNTEYIILFSTCIRHYMRKNFWFTGLIISLGTKILMKYILPDNWAYNWYNKCQNKYNSVCSTWWWLDESNYYCWYLIWQRYYDLWQLHTTLSLLNEVILWHITAPAGRYLPKQNDFWSADVPPHHTILCVWFQNEIDMQGL